MKKILLLVATFLTITFPSFAFADSLTTCTTAVDDSSCVADTYECTCTAHDTTYGPFTVAEASPGACAALCEVYAAEGTYNWYLGCTTSTARGKYDPEVKDVTLGSCTVVVTGTTISTQNNQEVVRNPVIPILNVPIPGLDFGDSVTYDSEGNQQANFLAKYIDALYRYLIVIATVVAVVMVMVGGLQYILSRGNADAVKKAKERITNAVIGLVLLFAAYDIAFLLDPNTVRFESLLIKTVPFQSVPEELSEDMTDYGQTSEVRAADVIEIDSTDATSKNIIVYAKEKLIAQSVYDALTFAAEDFHYTTQQDGNPLNIALTSASRSLTSQATMFYENCLEKGGYCSPDTCNIDGTDTTVVKKINGRWELQGAYGSLGKTSIISNLVSHGSGVNCMHTNNVAVDVWPEGQGDDYKFDVALQDLLITTMYNNEFCRIPNEPWHFELRDIASASCKSNSHKTSDYTRSVKGVKQTFSTSGCQQWSYKSPANCCLVATDNKNKPATMCK